MLHSFLFSHRDEFIILSGGAPYSTVDGDSVTIYENRETVTLQLTSPVKGMHIVESCLTDKDSGIVGISSDVGTTSTGKHVHMYLCTSVVDSCLKQLEREKEGVNERDLPFPIITCSSQGLNSSS